MPLVIATTPSRKIQFKFLLLVMDPLFNNPIIFGKLLSISSSSIEPSHPEDLIVRDMRPN